MSQSLVVSKETKITLGLAISLVGGILWLSTLHAKTEANSKAIDEVQRKQKEQDGKIEAVLINTTQANAKLDLLLTERKQK